MATKTSSRAAAGVQPRGNRPFECVTVNYTLDSSLSAGDVIQMVWVPTNARVTFVAVTMPLGIGVANVGDGLDTDRYVNLNFSAAAPYTIINTPYTSYTYSADDTIDVQISLVSAGGSASSGTISLTAHFVIDNSLT